MGCRSMMADSFMRNATPAYEKHRETQTTAHRHDPPAPSKDDQ